MVERGGGVEKVGEVSGAVFEGWEEVYGDSVSPTFSLFSFLVFYFVIISRSIFPPLSVFTVGGQGTEGNVVPVPELALSIVPTADPSPSTQPSPRGTLPNPRNPLPHLRSPAL